MQSYKCRKAENITIVIPGCYYNTVRINPKYIFIIFFVKLTVS